MIRLGIAVPITLGVIVLSLSLGCVGCSGRATPEPAPDLDLERMPLALVRSLFQSGYELVGYYERAADADSPEEVFAVLTTKLPLSKSIWGDTRVLLFDRRGGSWSLRDMQKIEGINARSEMRDLTDDHSPELLVFTEDADEQLGEFVAPLHYTDRLIVLTSTPDAYLKELGSFSSELVGVMHPRSAVGEWRGHPAVHTARDLPPTGTSLWRPFVVETFVWDGQEFTRVEAQKRRRISPLISWLVRRNAPWVVGSLVLGGVLGAVAVVLAHRAHLSERWALLALGLLLVGGGIGLGMRMTQERLCGPVLVLAGMAGLGVGRRLALTVRSIAGWERDTEVPDG